MVRHLGRPDHRHQLGGSGSHHLWHHSDCLDLDLRRHFFVRTGQCIPECWRTILLGQRVSPQRIFPIRILFDRMVFLGRKHLYLGERGPGRGQRWGGVLATVASGIVRGR